MPEITDVNSIIDELHDQVDGNFERMKAMLMEMAQRPHSPVLTILVTSPLQTRLKERLAEAGGPVRPAEREAFYPEEGRLFRLAAR